MEAKKKCCGTTFGLPFGLIFIVVITPAFKILNFNDIWEFKAALILQICRGTTHDHDDHQSHSHNDNNNNSKNSVTNTKFIPSEISPNRTSCHASSGRPDLIVYCCPPHDAESQIPIDFHFPDPSKSPIRVRRPIHRLDPEHLAKYAKAISIMKSLPYSDPRSFSRQADIHCVFCTGAYNINHSTRALDIHHQWLFFPFHRMYLYFHERILGSLIGDHSFALPFWPWDNPAAMYFPSIFHTDPFFDTERDHSHSGSLLLNLAYNPLDDNTTFTHLRDNLSFMYNQMVSAATKPELFMGCRLYPGKDGFCDGPGTMELAPHNTVHDWVGSSANPGRENMGSFYSAARDPSFYPHHANIDRLWDVWRDLHDMYVTFKDPVWLNSYFHFYDENAELVKIKVADVLNVTKLRYSYEPVDLVWLNHRPKPAVDPRIAKHELRKRVTSGQISHSAQNLGSPMRVKVHRPKPRRTKREIEEEVLVVYGIGVEARVNEMVKFDVYVNLVDESKIGPRYREFVGTFTRLPHGGKKYESRPITTLRLGISEALKDLEAHKDESIWVTLMPRSTSCVSVTIGGIKIEYMS